MPVQSVLLLLRPQAQHSNQTGQVAYAARPGRGRMDFGYEILRLRLDRNRLRTLFEGVRAMRESAGYQLILDEGRAEGAHRILLSLGRQKFGEPTEETKQTLAEIDDIERLVRMSCRMLEVETWAELLATP